MSEEVPLQRELPQDGATPEEEEEEGSKVRVLCLIPMVHSLAKGIFEIDCPNPLGLIKHSYKIIG